MFRYVAVFALTLLMVQWSTAFSFNGQSISITPALEKKEEATGGAETEADNNYEELEKRLKNITAFLNPFEELMHSGWPQEQAETGGSTGSSGDTGSTSSGSTGSTGGSGGSSGSGSASGSISGSGSTSGSTSTSASGSGSSSGTETETTSDSETEEEAEEEGLKETVFTGGEDQEFTNRNYQCFIRNIASGISGLCASRIHKDILYFVNDDGASIIYAVDVSDKCKVVSKITLDVEKGDWEDMACAPCQESDENCIYVSDTGKVDGEQAHLVYIVKEPSSLSEDHDYSKSDIKTIDYYVSSKYDLDDVQTLMVSPNSRYIFIMGKTEDVYPLYRLKLSSRGDYYASRRFNVKVWTSERGPMAGDISPDGKNWLFKMVDRVYTFSVDNEEDLSNILGSSSNRQKFPYYEEPYGVAATWSVTGGSYFTVSEGINEPVYCYYRTAA